MQWFYGEKRHPNKAILSPRSPAVQAAFQFEAEPPPPPMPRPRPALGAVTGPRLLIAWTPFWPQFLTNLSDALLRREIPALQLNLPAAEFWPDVFVERPFPWRNVAGATLLHVIAACVIALGTMLFVRQDRVRIESPFKRTQITYYKVDEVIPDFVRPARRPRARPSPGDPELARQEIISIPSDPDNSTQTIMNPPAPNILRQETPLPNLIVSAPQTAPKLAIPVALPMPRIAALRPRLETHRPLLAKTPVLPEPSVAPPPETRMVARKLSEIALALPEVQPVEAPKLANPAQALRQIEVAPTEVIPPPTMAEAPLKKLEVPVAEVMPPPAPASSGGPAAKGMGDLIALSVRPAPPPPVIEVPSGSRSGIFAATPSGHAGAAGTPEIKPQPAGPAGNGAGSTAAMKDAAAGTGIAVTGGGEKMAAGAVVAGPVAKRAAPATDLRRLMAANVPPAESGRRVPSSFSTPSEGHAPTPREQAVFGERRIYSMQVNLPNLTSAGGSWIIRFAEHSPVPQGGELSTPVAVSKVDPAYPQELIHDRVEGTVLLYAQIRADGTVGDIRVMEGFNDRLDENARVALAKWRFRPATRDGVAVELDAVVQIPFRTRRIAY